MAELVIVTILNKLKALFLVVTRVLLFDLLLFLFEEAPFKVSHDSYVLLGETGLVRALLKNLVAIFINFHGVAALVLQSLGFNMTFELDNELFLVLLDPPFHT